MNAFILQLNKKKDEFKQFGGNGKPRASAHNSKASSRITSRQNSGHRSQAQQSQNVGSKNSSYVNMAAVGDKASKLAEKQKKIGNEAEQMYAAKSKPSQQQVTSGGSIGSQPLGGQKKGNKKKTEDIALNAGAVNNSGPVKKEKQSKQNVYQEKTAGSSVSAVEDTKRHSKKTNSSKSKDDEPVAAALTKASRFTNAQGVTVDKVPGNESAVEKVQMNETDSQTLLAIPSSLSQQRAASASKINANSPIFQPHDFTNHSATRLHDVLEKQDSVLTHEAQASEAELARQNSSLEQMAYNLNNVKSFNPNSALIKQFSAADPFQHSTDLVEPNQNGHANLPFSQAPALQQSQSYQPYSKGGEQMNQPGASNSNPRQFYHVKNNSSHFVPPTSGLEQSEPLHAGNNGAQFHSGSKKSPPGGIKQASAYQPNRSSNPYQKGNVINLSDQLNLQSQARSSPFSSQHQHSQVINLSDQLSGLVMQQQQRNQEFNAGGQGHESNNLLPPAA